jgi:uncharacterized protein (UPF0332 family)
MNLRAWIRDGSVKRFHPHPVQIDDLLMSSFNDIDTARELIKLHRYGFARDAAYEAMLKAGMVMMFAHGLRPVIGGHHVTIVRFTESELGKGHEELIASFDRFRRTRHERLYEGKDNATKSEAMHAIDCAEQLLNIARERSTIKEVNYD